MKFLKSFLVNILFILVIANNSVYASMADFTDEDAEKETQKMIQEYKENFDNNKSDNNFLKDLTVTGGVLSPNFDRQIIEYSLKLDNNISEIQITANVEDSEAKIEGTGKIDISNISEHKISVIAPSGTTRTYVIKIAKENDIKKENIDENKNESNENEIKENITIGSNISKEELNDKFQKNNNLKYYYLLAFILILLLACVFIIIKKNNKHTKH